MAKDETEVITLEFDDGEEIECTIIGVFDYIIIVQRKNIKIMA